VTLELVDFNCLTCGWTLATVPSATVWCSCGMQSKPDAGDWLTAMLADSRARSELAGAARRASLPWSAVTSSADRLGVRRVQRNGATTWRLPKRASGAPRPFMDAGGES